MSDLADQIRQVKRADRKDTINVAVGMIGLWSTVLLFVPRADYHWSAVPYFIFSGVVGTAAGRLFRVAAIEKVGAPVAPLLAAAPRQLDRNRPAAHSV